MKNLLLLCRNKSEITEHMLDQNWSFGNQKHEVYNNWFKVHVKIFEFCKQYLYTQIILTCTRFVFKLKLMKNLLILRNYCNRSKSNCNWSFGFKKI